MNSPKGSAAAGMREFDAAIGTEFRRAMGLFASGVVVVAATEEGGTPVGMTCQSFCSLSLVPPLVMFSPSTTSTTFPHLRQARSICVNVLSHDQHELSTQFAISGTDKWRGVRWTAGRNGAPRIAGAAMWCEGDIEAVYEGGDHYVVIVRVMKLATAVEPAPPLIFHAGRYARLQPATP
jgi:flavin reductase (DIM6/NTAB) family NADH-FMN oxidoreductase RutF